MTANDLHALAIQLQLCGERGGTLPPDVIRDLGVALRRMANTHARMERTLDELVEEARAAAADEELRTRQSRVIRGLVAGLPCADSLSILKRGQAHG